MMTIGIPTSQPLQRDRCYHTIKLSNGQVVMLVEGDDCLSIATTEPEYDGPDCFICKITPDYVRVMPNSCGGPADITETLKQRNVAAIMWHPVVLSNGLCLGLGEFNGRLRLATTQGVSHVEDVFCHIADVICDITSSGVEVQSMEDGVLEFVRGL